MINVSNNTKVPDSLRREVTALLVSLERNKMLIVWLHIQMVLIHRDIQWLQAEATWWYRGVWLEILSFSHVHDLALVAKQLFLSEENKTNNLHHGWWRHFASLVCRGGGWRESMITAHTHLLVDVPAEHTTPTAEHSTSPRHLTEGTKPSWQHHDSYSLLNCPMISPA